MQLWLALAAIVLVIAVEHELGHYLAARHLGIPVRFLAVGIGPVLWQRHLANGGRFIVRAFPVGLAIGVPGRREADGRPRRSIRHEVILACSGAAANCALALLLMGAALLVGSGQAAFVWLTIAAGLAVTLAAINLLPLPGLDGGHLLLLALAKLGIALSPQREARLHRYGVRFLAILCTAACAAYWPGLV